jgi:hypothetical protein
MKKDSNQTEIVLVHLGKNLPGYLFRNIEHISELFPNITINLIVSKNNNHHAFKMKNVNIVYYQPSKNIDDLIESKIIDLSFRNGFWRYTLERLFSIEQLHSAKPTKSFLYVESDVLILPGFPLSAFSNLAKIHWLPADYESDIASLIYFPRYRLTQQFAQDLLNYLQKSIAPTDMKGLRYLRENYPERYKLLPTGNSNFPQLTKGNKVYAQSSISYFCGVFDSAAIGMWLTGVDPRLTYGFKKYFDTNMVNSEKSIIDPSAYRIMLSEDRKMYFNFQKHLLPIYNLHIHSKSKKLLSKNWYNELSILVKNADNNKVRTKFYPKVLAKLILDNFSNKTLLPFIYYSPMLKPVRIFKKKVQGKR